MCIEPLLYLICSTPSPPPTFHPRVIQVSVLFYIKEKIILEHILMWELCQQEFLYIYTHTYIVITNMLKEV